MVSGDEIVLYQGVLISNTKLIITKCILLKWAERKRARVHLFSPVCVHVAHLLVQHVENVPVWLHRVFHQMNWLSNFQICQ